MHLRRIVTLGETNGEGYLIHEADIVLLDAMERVWVLQRNAPRLFDLEGRFLLQLGEMGEGPGEFRDLITGFVDDRSRIHLIDVGNVRETVFSADLELLQTRRTPGLVVRAAPLTTVEGYVANMSVSTPEAFGLPLHFVLGSPPRIQASVAPSSQEGPVRPVMSFLRLSVGGSAEVFTATDDYRIDVWDETGKPLRTLIGERVWGLSEDRFGRALRAEDAPELYGQIMAIHVDERERLWLSAWVPKEDWRANIGVRPDGSMYRDNPETVYDSLIDVVDLRTGTLIARRIGGPLVAGFVNDSIVHGPAYQPSGEYKLALSSISVRPN